jgi:hypothetical protein
MPLRKEDDRGTNSDGSRNRDYCCFCYASGQFTDEGITMADKIEKMVAKAKEVAIPPENARLMAQAILPTLKRWRANG